MQLGNTHCTTPTEGVAAAPNKEGGSTTPQQWRAGKVPPPKERRRKAAPPKKGKRGGEGAGSRSNTQKEEGEGRSTTQATGQHDDNLDGLTLKSPEVNDVPYCKCDPGRIDDSPGGLILIRDFKAGHSCLCALVLFVRVFLQWFSLSDPFTLFSSSRLCHVHIHRAHLRSLFHRNLTLLPMSHSQGYAKFQHVSTESSSLLHRRQTIPLSSPTLRCRRGGWTSATLYRTILPKIITEMRGADFFELISICNDCNLMRFNFLN